MNSCNPRLRITYLSNLLLLLLLFLPGLAGAGEIQVEVQGLDGELKKNVLAELTIYQKRKQKDLRESEILWLLNKGPENIRTALEPFGFYTPEIVWEKKEVDGTLHVLYQVELGKPVIISEVTISLVGQGSNSPEIIQAAKEFPLKEGEVLTHSFYKIGKKNIVNRAHRLGFLDAAYRKSEIRVHREERWASLELVFDTGPQFYFGETRSSQELIEPELLQRFLHYTPGEPFSTKKLMELQRALYKTEYFSEVDIRGSSEDAENFQVPVIISLSEPQYYNRYSIGAGFATDTGLQGRFEWDNRLFNRRGHTVSGALKVAEKESNFLFSYRVPVNNPRYDKLIYSGSWQHETWEDTTTRVFSGGIRFEHLGERYTYGVSLDFQDERYSIDNKSSSSTHFIPGVDVSMVAAGDILNTENGLLLSASLKGSKEGFISDTDFLQGVFGGKMILTPFENWRLIGRFTLGGTLVESIEELPPSLRFYAGGDQSVRGYGYKEIGPEDEEGTVIGGKYLIVGSAELERRLFENWSVAGFMDAGNAMNDKDYELKTGVGMGVRYRLPFGQARLDVAVPLDDSDHTFRLHFSIGGDL